MLINNNNNNRDNMHGEDEGVVAGGPNREGKAKGEVREGVGWEREREGEGEFREAQETKIK